MRWLVFEGIEWSFDRAFIILYYLFYAGGSAWLTKKLWRRVSALVAPPFNPTPCYRRARKLLDVVVVRNLTAATTT